MSTYTLDFSLTTEEDRCMLISSICSQTSFTPTQYTQMADYILLANHKENNTYPEIFTSPKTVHPVSSLDELLEKAEEIGNIDALEASFTQIQRNPYIKLKRKIDRSNPLYVSIPNMQELWKTIDNVKAKLDSNPDDYRLKRYLITLYQQQYALAESALPQKFILPLRQPPRSYLHWEEGILLENGIRAKLDLSDPSHMARFLIYYPLLKDYCTSQDCDLYQLLADTEQALSLIELTPLQQDVLSLYQHKTPIKEMQSYLLKKHNRTLTQAYLSTILHKQIATKVSFEYAEIRNSRIYANDPTKWRICLHCKQKKLLSTHNFHRLSNKPGGYAQVCKECKAKEKLK